MARPRRPGLRRRSERLAGARAGQCRARKSGVRLLRLAGAGSARIRRPRGTDRRGRARLARGARATGGSRRRPAGASVRGRHRRLQVERDRGLGRRRGGGCPAACAPAGRGQGALRGPLRPVPSGPRRLRRRRARGLPPDGRGGVLAAVACTGSARTGRRECPPPICHDRVRGSDRPRRVPLGAGAWRETRTGSAPDRGSWPPDRLYPWPVRRKSNAGRFAERVLHGVDDAGVEERIVIWIERLPGALWAVGRAVNPHLRASDEPRPDDYVFQGYELEDALEQANGALRDDGRVSEQDGRAESIAPFEREELLRALERWFFG